jgi:hypothetical protein
MPDFDEQQQLVLFARQHGDLAGGPTFREGEPVDPGPGTAPQGFGAF